MATFDSIRASAVCVALAIPHFASAAVELRLPEPDRGSAWFAPALVTHNREMCDMALQAERSEFFAPDDPQPDITGLAALTTKDDKPIADPDVAALNEYPLELTLTLPNRSRAFVRFEGYPGCGGGCETAAVRIDDERIVDDQSAEVLPRTDRYGPNRWRLFKDPGGDFYLRGRLDDHTQWYRVAASNRFELACDIALRPDTSNGKAAVYSQEVFDAIESLRVAAARMAGDGSGCGGMAARFWPRYRQENLEMALYRPWAVVERHEFESDNSARDYARIADQLQLWSLGGVMEFGALTAYQTELARATASVAQFYRAKFRWAPDRAAEMADAALKGAISSGFGFYDYFPYRGLGERELRQAILSRAPLEQIRSITFNVGQIDREGQDSILNVAIEYPEALGYLLQNGFNPNIGNEFGKTPLMYAAQYNQAAAAELLLNAGADANATTHLPQDSCAFSIVTESLTPLHYAARYSSARLIQLLLDRGAVTFIQSTGGGHPEYPLDRLHRYAGAGEENERNPHIAAAEIDGLARLLAIPSDSQRHTMATDLVTRARSAYSRGDTEQAYQKLRLALLAQPDRFDAIADLPLIALRAGYIGPAISAANRATRTLTRPDALAAAWFNKGLICEHPQALEVVTIDDARCDLDPLQPFVQSWKLQPSAVRGDKLQALIHEKSASCLATDPGRHYRIALKDLYQSFRIYALHPAKEEIDTAQIRWAGYESQSGPVEPKLAGAHVVDRFSLGEQEVTLLEVPVSHMSGNPRKLRLWIEGRECSPEL